MRFDGQFGSENPDEELQAGDFSTQNLQGMLEFSLDDAIEYLGLDEVAEVTPKSVRLSKKP